MVHELRRVAITEEENERALKWVLWMPQGLLHAPTRGGKNGNKQFKELARRFVLWRQRDMEGLIRTWQKASNKASKKLSKREAGVNKSDKARIDRAMRMLRKGAISRAPKAMECKESGDLSDPELIQQMQNKHPVRIRQIGPDIYTFVPEEEVVLKVDKILGKLSNEVARGPARRRNAHIKVWMGAFAVTSADTTIHHLEEFITYMANDRLPPWFI